MTRGLAKPSLVIADLLKGEAASIDRNLPEIYKLIERRALEYLAQLKPALAENYSTVTGSKNLKSRFESRF